MKLSDKRSSPPDPSGSVQTKLTTVSRMTVFKNRKRILQNPLPFHRENFDRNGDTFLVDTGFGNRVVFTRNAEIIRHILRKNHRNYHKSTLQTQELAKYIGNGILTSNGDFWRAHRRMVQPAFHRKKLEGLLKIMNSAIQSEITGVQGAPLAAAALGASAV